MDRNRLPLYRKATTVAISINSVSRMQHHPRIFIMKRIFSNILIKIIFQFTHGSFQAEYHHVVVCLYLCIHPLIIIGSPSRISPPSVRSFGRCRSFTCLRVIFESGRATNSATSALAKVRNFTFDTSASSRN